MRKRIASVYDMTARLPPPDSRRPGRGRIRQDRTGPRQSWLAPPGSASILQLGRRLVAGSQPRRRSELTRHTDARSVAREFVHRIQNFDPDCIVPGQGSASRSTDRTAVDAALRAVRLFRRVAPPDLEALPLPDVAALVEIGRRLWATFEALRKPGPDGPASTRGRLELADEIQHGCREAEILIGESRLRAPLPDTDANDNPTSRSLAEQLELNEFEVERRKELLGFTPADGALLRAAQPLVLEHIDTLVGDFYRAQTAIPEIALRIGDSTTLQRLEAAQRAYVIELFGGEYDGEYVDNRLRIGLVHKRIGVAPKLYLSAAKILRDMIRAVLEAGIADRPTARATIDALDKLLTLDAGLVFDTYIRSSMAELENAKVQAIRYAREVEDRAERRSRELAQLSRTDSLTGLLNRGAFRFELRRELARARRLSAPLTLVYLDVDGFKQINDSQGHRRGDDVLRRIGREIAAMTREVDVCSRIGGDEFCLALPNSQVGGGQHFVDRLRSRAGSGLAVEISAGIVQAGPQDIPGVDELIELADRAMYEDKRRRRDTRIEAVDRDGFAD
ncbi:MAG: GGDEF domain-containing protein [Planctomycetes bacterium]|nr:GGDEF domain-containing protein [Planctomycetota bacterium]